MKCRRRAVLSLAICCCIAVFANAQRRTVNQCAAVEPAAVCGELDLHLRQRTYDGTCNNLRHFHWGASSIPLLRLLPPEYEDGTGSPIGFFDLRYSGYRKANPREVSQEVIAAKKIENDIRNTAMIGHWGQFQAHDLSHSFEMVENCTTASFEREMCFNIDIPISDRRIPQFETFPFMRSQSCSERGRRQQLNMVTAYMDGSHIYGSNEAVARLLRGSDGLLRENDEYRSFGGLAYLPFDSEPSENTPCHRNKSQSSIHCFLAGDRRTNEQLMLLSLHTLFFREHNRIARELRQVNREWSTERIYQEARKMIGAIIQKITFDDWLPIIIGPVGMTLVGNYEGYKPDTNTGMDNAVATAAMRFGHGLMVPVLRRLDPNFESVPEGDVLLRDAFFAPHKLLQEGGIDPLLRGAVASPTKDIVPDGMVNSELTDHLFPNFHRFALDLPALNIQRGRDHALPPYNSFRELCGLHRITSWDALKLESRDARAVDRLAELYGHPDNLDLWVGGMIERPLRGAKIGRTFTCLLADQYRRVREGDRFFFRNPDSFGKLQQEAISNYSLSRIICNNIDNPDRMPENAFIFYHLGIQQYRKCRELTNLNISLWRISEDGFAGTLECSSDDCLCQYRIGTWGQCDTRTGKQDRVDRLVAGNFPPCTTSRTITRRCAVPAARAFISPIKNRRVSEINVNLNFNDEALGLENMRLRNGNRQFGDLLNRRHDLFSNIKSPLSDGTQFRGRSA